MRIGIIGSGMIGTTAARLFVRAGHQVAIANRRGRESLEPLVQELGPNLRATSVSDAAHFGDLVLVAVPFGIIDALPAEAFAGKIVVDANNYNPGRDGDVAALDNDITTSTELLAAHLPGARMVKAFNTMHYATLADGGGASRAHDDRLAIFVASDDADAKKLVGALIDELGFAAVDTGGLASGGRRQQPGSAVYGSNLTAAEARPILS